MKNAAITIIRTLCLIAPLALMPGVAKAQPWKVAAGACPASTEGASVEFEVRQVRAAKGKVILTVYGDRPEEFLAKGKKLAKVKLPAHSGSVTGCLTLPRPGTYALAVFHDEDDNGKLSRSMVGLPSEGWAFPNDPKLILGPPSFEEVALPLQARVNAVSMMMSYP